VPPAPSTIASPIIEGNSCYEYILMKKAHDGTIGPVCLIKKVLTAAAIMESSLSNPPVPSWKIFPSHTVWSAQIDPICYGEKWEVEP